MRLGTELRTDRKHHDRCLAMMDQELLPSSCLHFLHWKKDLAITAVRNSDTKALLGADTGHGKSQDKLPAMKEQSRQTTYNERTKEPVGVKLSPVLPKPISWDCDSFSLSIWSLG